MTKVKSIPASAAVQELMAGSPDGLRDFLRAVMQEMLEAEMADALGAGNGGRTAARVGYRSGYYSRTLVTRTGLTVLLVTHEPDMAAYAHRIIHFKDGGWTGSRERGRGLSLLAG